MFLQEKKKQQDPEANQSRPLRGDFKFEWDFYLHYPTYVYGLVFKHLYQSKRIYALCPYTM
jgi:hypothetical protein